MSRLALFTLLTGLYISGCGGSKPALPTDTKPFEAAINDYLQSKSYGMKIASVERIEEKRDAATAVCKMQEAEGTYSMNVRWEFTFRRTDSGWQVETHTPK